MKKWLIGGGILAAIVIAYFVFKRKKAAPAADTGGQFTPKVLTAEDWTSLEKTFASGNPYLTERALAIEGQGQDETSAIAADGTQKTAITKQQFNNLVLALIRQHIGAKSGWIQEEENRRFDSWSGAARAGYADSLARAWAYVARVYVAGTNYYTDTTSGSSGSSGNSTGLTTEQAAVKAAGAPENFYLLAWKVTNAPGILIAAISPVGSYQLFSLRDKTIISAMAARNQGWDGRIN